MRIGREIACYFIGICHYAYFLTGPEIPDGYPELGGRFTGQPDKFPISNIQCLYVDGHLFRHCALSIMTKHDIRPAYISVRQSAFTASGYMLAHILDIFLPYRFYSFLIPGLDGYSYRINIMGNITFDR